LASVGTEKCLAQSESHSFPSWELNPWYCCKARSGLADQVYKNQKSGRLGPREHAAADEGGESELPACLPALKMTSLKFRGLGPWAGW
jgi:hypothetical protein